ncbi:non-ribosomal peptide synthetase/type I polyketide synthase [Hyalangium versicolor]|uniref:non-ribosomal peptide synthetase/type I polyketide synthase n=1 Tax=Hyalangium versicolor TaxID=2861190 RepID=UPI001CCD906B|nr:non-ribosomal peptide synthetase/type I polyketide synthase [Hyalangium versicolor]
MRREPIAIIGIGCRYPGARDPRALWKLLAEGVDAVTEVPPERWDARAFYDPDPGVEGKMNTRWGGFLKDVDRFDPQFFKIAPREADSMDPQQRLLLEVTWEALEDAGLIPDHLAGTKTGVFVGISAFDYYSLMCQDTRNIGPHFSTGNTHAVAANRISYLFDFRGPSIALDTACSSSLVSTHLGCQSLWSGESTLAVAGGAHLLLFPWLNVAYSKAGLMSPVGRCKTFDASADGYVRSEGAGIVVLKRLSEALADGNQIYAIIRGSAVNQDGRSNGLTAPNPKAQEAVLRAAYLDANVDQGTVQYVEAHGSGTKLGDPIELKSLAAVVAEGRAPGDFCWVGALKSNVGHAEAAAGVGGLIKAVLALQHRQIPPSIHFKNPNPYIPFDKIPLRVPTSLLPWPEVSGPRLAGVSAFGFGGTNAHIVLEEAPVAASGAVQAGSGLSRPLHLLTLRARSKHSLKELAQRHQEFLAEQPEVSIADVCYSANTGRTSFAHRIAVAAQSMEELRERLRAFVHDEEIPGIAYSEVTKRKPPKVAFLFTGLGVQHEGMGRQLYETQPVFRAALERCDELLRGQMDRSLLSLLYPPPGEEPPKAAPETQAQNNGRRRTFLKPTRASLLDETLYAQPALFALQYALAELWRSWGVEPAFLLGHSVGEIAAACVASVFSLEDGLRLVVERARLMQALQRNGAMVAILAPVARVSAMLAEHGQGAVIAAINGPENVVVSGEREAVRAFVASVEAAGLITQPLRVAQASHSPLIEPMLDDLERVVNSLRIGAPHLPLVSNVTGGVLPAGHVLDSAYWRKQARAPVQFQAGIESLRAEGCQFFVEIGPTPVLTYLGSQFVLDGETRWLPSLVEHQSDWSVILGSLSALYLGGVEVDWKGFDKGYPRKVLSLPNYPFDRKRYWFGDGASTSDGPLVKIPAPPAVAPAPPAIEPAPPAIEPAPSPAPRAIVLEMPPPVESAPAVPLCSVPAARGNMLNPEVPVAASSARRNEIVSSMRQMLVEILHSEQSEVSPHVAFLEMGADSISLVELVQRLETKYKQEISLRALFEELTTIDALASHIEQRLPPEPVAPPVAEAQGKVTPPEPAPSQVSSVQVQKEAPRTGESVPMPQARAATNSARRQAIVSTLSSTVASMLRISQYEVDPDVSFLNLGADSTMLIEVVRLLDYKYRKRISIRELFDGLNTVNALADHIDQHLPPEPASPQVSEPPRVAPSEAAPRKAEPERAPQHIESPRAPQPVVQEPVLIPRAAVAVATPSGATAPTDMIERVFSQQMQLLSKQLEILRGIGMALEVPLPASQNLPRAAAPEAPLAPPVTPPAPPPAPMLPKVPPAPAAGSEMNSLQDLHLRSFVDRYNRRTKRSKESAAEYRPELADSRAVAGFRLQIKELSYPIVGSRYRGARIWDVDGNEYVDITMGFGVHLFGHGAPVIHQAIQEQLERGFGVGPQPERAGELARLFVEVTGVERVTFCQSGSEAVMTALRLARTATGRAKVALFKGAYHGHFDGVLAQQSALPLTPGVSAGAVRDVVVLDYGESSAIEYLKQNAHEFAAVLVEPVQSRRPDLQPRAFLHELRAITEAAGTALIFDEIVTGLRAHPGGAQAIFGVRADLATYGKILGGGMPLAAVGGKQRFMDGIDGGQWRYGDLSQPQAERTFFAGTFNKPPLALATALAVLRHLRERGPRLQEELNERTTRLAERLNQYFEREAVPARVVHFGSLFRFVLKGNLELFYYHLIDRGVYVWEGRNCFLSTAHTDADIDYIFQAVRDSMEELRAGGFFPGPPGGPRPAADRGQSAGSTNGSGSQGLAMRAPVSRSKAGDTPRGKAESGPSRWRRSREDLEFSLSYFGRYEAAYRKDKYDLLFEGARFADANGFSAIWVPERHFHPFGGFSPNPSVLCAALARETQRVALRAGSVVVPLHHPVRIAEEWAVVDNISGGRVGISVASGWHPDDFVFAPEAYGKHRELMFEGIETIRKLWRGEALRMRAGANREIDVRCFPMPTPRELPVWLTITGNPDTYVRAGEIGAGVLTNLMSQTLEELAANIELYRKALERSGRDPSTGHVTVLLHTYLGEDLQATREKARKPFCDYLDTHFGLLQGVLRTHNPAIDPDKLSAEDRRYMLSLAYDRYVRTSALIGTQESSEEIIERLREVGVDEVACFVDFGMDERSAREGLPVLAALKDRYRRGKGLDGGRSLGQSQVSTEREGELLVPLTVAQREALALVDLAATDAAIGASVCFEMRGPLRLDSLRRALEGLVSRHETLRTTITEARDAFRIARSGAVPLDVTDLSATRAEELDRAATEWLIAEGRKGFDLIHGPVFRASVASFSQRHHLLLLSTHHTLCDGWSIGVIADEMGKLYSADYEGKSCQLPEVMQFREYVASREAMRGTPEMAEHEHFWRERLAGNPPQLDLPTDRPRPRVKTYRASRQSHRIDARLCKELHRVARENNVSFFTITLSAYLLLLHRLSGQDELIVGVPVAGQIGERGRALVGHCANLLPIHSNLAGCETFAELLQRTKTVLLEAFDHREYSIHTLVAMLPMARDPSRIPLVSVVFNLDHGNPPKMAQLEVGYWHTQPIEFALSETSLNAVELNGELLLDWNYNEDLFDAETVERWRGCYAALLESASATPRMRLAEISIVPAAEQRRILAWNDTRTSFPAGDCLHELFELQASRTPDALAVACGLEELTFRELSRRSSQLAHHLRALGVGAETRVALCLERSVEMIVAVLAILKAGGAYVPLDPNHPAERVAFILSNSKASLLLTDARFLARLTVPLAVRPLCIEQLGSTLAAYADTPPAAGAALRNAAYVLYTSGSTGQPRGVVVEHRSVVNLLHALQTAIYSRYAGRPLRVSVNGTIAFDTSVKQIIQLLHGHALDIVPEALRLDGAGFCDHIRRRGIEVLDCTPTQLGILVSAGILSAPGALRCVLVGGEAIDEALWQQLSRAPIDFFNVYGPTECTVDATVCHVKPEHPRPVLGKPLANVRVYVLDRHQQMVPVGTPGELFIGGAGVARGYLDDPALTAERFLRDPFSDEPGARMYRTGDKGRFLRDGSLEFLGRLDHQIKLRGFRVELGEIEVALARLPGVESCVVVGREDVPGEKRLVAYFVPRDGHPALAPEKLKQALRAHLPEYMVPSAFVALSALPLTPHGKVDRNALPAEDAAALGISDAYVAPRTPTEQLLAGIWSEVLRVPPVGIHSNFFGLGGHSLLAVQVLARVREVLHIDIAIRTLFDAPTVAGLALAIEARGSSCSAAAAPVGASALHQVKRVKVAEGVELEVLDFGGQGPALVFMTGRGNTAHVFDTFAPEFTSAYHVYSVTRRGYGSSSWPEQGYDTATLGTDIVRVLDSQGIAKAVFVGHSRAGEEITWVATHHPDRVAKVVFLDIQINGDLVAELRKDLSEPTPLEPSSADLVSRATVAAALARSIGGPLPEHEIDEMVDFDPKTGRFLRNRKRPDADAQVSKSASQVDFAAIRTPVLFIHTGDRVPERAEDYNGFAQMPPPQQEKLRTVHPRMIQREAEIQSLPNWRLVQLERADHYIWITNRDDVLREMKAFFGMLEALPYAATAEAT